MGNQDPLLGPLGPAESLLDLLHLQPVRNSSTLSLLHVTMGTRCHCHGPAHCMPNAAEGTSGLPPLPLPSSPEQPCCGNQQLTILRQRCSEEQKEGKDPQIKLHPEKSPELSAGWNPAAVSSEALWPAVSGCRVAD